jgi:hypothetical protein
VLFGDIFYAWLYRFFVHCLRLNVAVSQIGGYRDIMGYPFVGPLGEMVDELSPPG